MLRKTADGKLAATVSLPVYSKTADPKMEASALPGIVKQLINRCQPLHHWLNC
jgi:hypothetical protein